MSDRHVPDGATRVGHAERLATIDELSTALAEGRLEMDEADERIGAATLAKTYDDLRVLTTDLPASAPTKGLGGLDLQRSMWPVIAAAVALAVAVILIVRRTRARRSLAS